MGVGVIVLNTEGQVLLGQRNRNRKKAKSVLRGEGTWTLPGGKVRHGETLEAATVRELVEETGIVASPESLKLISLSQEILAEAHFITIGFLLQGVTDQPEEREPEAITNWQWFKLDSLPTPLFFPSERIISNYKNQKIYKSAPYDL